jgi:hypothetical protein
VIRTVCFKVALFALLLVMIPAAWLAACCAILGEALSDSQEGNKP